jgi:hypothetical protein
VGSQLSWEEPDQCGEDGAVGPVQPGPGVGAAQHGDLVPQHQQFDVLRGGRATEQDQPAAEPSEDKVEQAKGHGRSSCPTADRCHIAAAHRPGILLAPHSHLARLGAYKTSWADLDCAPSQISPICALQRVTGRRRKAAPNEAVTCAAGRGGPGHGVGHLFVLRSRVASRRHRRNGTRAHEMP